MTPNGNAAGGRQPRPERRRGEEGAYIVMDSRGEYILMNSGETNGEYIVTDLATSDGF